MKTKQRKVMKKKYRKVERVFLSYMNDKYDTVWINRGDIKRYKRCYKNVSDASIKRLSNALVCSYITETNVHLWPYPTTLITIIESIG